MSANVAHVAVEFLRPLRRWLEREGVTELCINQPGEVLLETAEGWASYEDDALRHGRLVGMMNSIANQTKQSVGVETPILSATMPAGERVQVVCPPVTREGRISFTVRRPADEVFSLDDYERQGAFDQVTFDLAGVSDTDRELLRLKEAGRTKEFLRLAVATRKNILVSGATGSGKTTLMKALVQEVSPKERLISIENVDELGLDTRFPNAVPLFYSGGGQSRAAVGQKELLESSLRMKPDRIFVAELIRGDEAFYYLRNVNSGHPGSITSIHANSARLAFEQLVLFLKESPAGRGLERRELRAMLTMSVDIVVQMHRIGRDRKVTEIYYDPHERQRVIEANQ